MAELPYNTLRLSLRYKSRAIDLQEKLERYKREMVKIRTIWSVLGHRINRKPTPPQMEEVVAYKVVKGDQVDEMMAKHLEDIGCTVKVVRTGQGKYMFGTKSVMAKVINDKLVIRVGGGYMGAEKFIQQYGPMEMAKILEASG